MILNYTIYYWKSNTLLIIIDFLRKISLGINFSPLFNALSWKCSVFKEHFPPNCPIWFTIAPEYFSYVHSSTKFLKSFLESKIFAFVPMRAYFIILGDDENWKRIKVGWYRVPGRVLHNKLGVCIGTSFCGKPMNKNNE